MKKWGKTAVSVMKMQFAVIIYTMASIFAKLASGEEFFSGRFVLYCFLEITFLGAYAVAWQQIIKKTDLSVAYANREMYLLWSMLWAALLFQNRITPQNAAGCILIIAGALIITGEDGKKRL